ncbi:MAG TPA: transcriptional regulator [Terracidiphilus sp.]|nr:transcriptional regulator [Terracidiphilus sp.]
MSIGFQRKCLDRISRRTVPVCMFAAFFLLWSASTFGAETPWASVGPDGGDARAFAAVPGDASHLYMGTTTSWIYESTDGGGSWRRLARLGTDDSLVIDHILVDEAEPATIYAAGWTLSHPGGGLWVSHDAGAAWSELEGLRGQSIRAFVQAPSNPAMLFAGTLEGVYRSDDHGMTWAGISPAGSREIHEVESLAVDPANPQIVYAGTWHLPWKTDDGGANWHNIKKGVIDDSDVFSIIIDPEKPHVVYASACSGIYKSETAGELFRKIQGIPATARRTRVLRQDPQRRETVYAGTTQGLYKTTDGGRTFKRMTGDDVIVNDVFVDPANSKRVLLATDRGGVLASDDGGVTFAPSNAGVSERKVGALLVDHADAQRVYAGVVNDKAYGGVFVSDDGGAQWKQIADGLDGRDVFVLAEDDDGTILAGTSSGIFALNPDATHWEPRTMIANTLVKVKTETVRGTHVNIVKHVKDQPHVMDGRVLALDLNGDAWLASTTGGVYTSRDKGATWQGGPVLGVAGYLSVAAQGATMAAAQPNGIVLSHDGGATWWPLGIPTVLTRIHRIAFSPDGTLWIGAREGVYFTRDGGKTWMWVHRLPLVDLDDLTYDAGLGKLLVSSRGSDFVYAIDAKMLEWTWWETGYRISAVRAAGGRLLAASLEDGVLVEPAGAQEVGKR